MKLTNDGVMVLNDRRVKLTYINELRGKAKGVIMRLDDEDYRRLRLINFVRQMRIVLLNKRLGRLK